MALAYTQPAQLLGKLGALVDAWAQDEPAQREADVAAVADAVEEAATFDMSQLRSFSERVLLQSRAVQVRKPRRFGVRRV